MAGFASNYTTTKSPGPPQRSLSRRVSFNEATIARHQTFSDDGSSDLEAQQRSPPPKGCGRICNSCCACASIIVGIIVLIALVLAGMYFAFLQSNMPEVRLRRLDLYDLNVTNTNDSTFLTGGFLVTLNVTNKDSRSHITYGPMTGTIMSEGINLGTAKLPGVHQGPGSSVDFKVPTQVHNIPVEDGAGAELYHKSQEHLMVITVNLGGHVDFRVSGHKMTGFPFKITCYNIDESEIDDGHAPLCLAKMTLF